MTGQSYETQTAIRETVQEYLEKPKVISLRKIAEYVEKKIGVRPSPTTIARLLREQDYDRTSAIWEKKT